MLRSSRCFGCCSATAAAVAAYAAPDTARALRSSYKRVLSSHLSAILRSACPFA